MDFLSLVWPKVRKQTNVKIQFYIFLGVSQKFWGPLVPYLETTYFISQQDAVF